MPELPEVETVLRGLKPLMEGENITAFKVNVPKLRNVLPEGLAELITNRNIIQLTRRGKYILVELEGNLMWIIHLGMSGRIRFSHNYAPQKHDHVCWQISNNWVMFNDARRFGSMDFIYKNDLHHHSVSRLGAEPFDIKESDFFNLIQSSVNIKTHLLNQKIVAGVGNIYASEALWLAGIDPQKVSKEITKKQSRGLLNAIQIVLNKAIDAGGTTLRDFQNVSGELGYFQHHLNVYNRASSPCFRKGCSGTIRRIIQVGRSTFYCDQCQKS